MSHFDSLKVTAFNVASKVMGYDAEWISSESNVLYKARVFYKDPSEEEKLSGIDSWDPEIPYMEYRVGNFPGLKQLTDKSSPEEIIISGKGLFVVQEVTTKSDGDTFVARLIKQ